MLPINQSINNLRPADLGNLNPSEKNSSINSYVINLESRIEQNRPLIEDLKRDRGFQNTLTLLRRESISDRQLLDFLTGKVSLEECEKTLEKLMYSNARQQDTPLEELVAEKKWMVQVLVRTYKALEPRWSGTSHFLPKSLTDPLAAIFSHGYWESEEKTHYKMNALMQAIELGKLDLSRADLSDINFDYVNLAEANLAWANLVGASTIGTNFLNANLLGVNWESKKVRLAGQEINRALYMFDAHGLLPEAFEILKAVYENNKSAFSKRNSDPQLIMDKLLEAALEIFLNGSEGPALTMLREMTADTKTGMWRYDWEARTCLTILKRCYIFENSNLVEDTLKGSILKRTNLKCTPYLLGKLYESRSITGSKRNYAKEYLEIATARGYEPLTVRKQRKEYQLMSEAQKSNESVFSHVPNELVSRIARLRFEATFT
ncbi:MAG: hypothetical protein K0R08_1477 [Solimicrobium sp.]|jgi:hypothetical protein|nr:hypothetical protein [Solimicrobium sp.]